MLLGYLPKHIDIVATIIRNCDSKHPLAKSSAIIKLLLQTALRVHKKIAHARKMLNDAYFRQKCELQHQIDEQNSDDDEQPSSPVLQSSPQYAFLHRDPNELDESESEARTNVYPPGLFDDINEDAEEESN